MADYVIDGAVLTDIADAIREKTGGAEPITPEAMAEAVQTIKSGGSKPQNDVNYYDYDGTILYSYTAEEAMALTEEPALPEQEGLICQGWNISLEDMQSYVSKYGKRDVGATYITDDGATRFYITLGEFDDLTVAMCAQRYGKYSTTATIDWGDGSAPEIISQMEFTATHIYSTQGDYIISLLPDEESTLQITYNVMKQDRSNNKGGILKRVAIGKSVTEIRSSAFSHCRSLESITIPNGVTTISGGFNCCYSLKSVTIPSGATISSNLFQECCKLSSLSLPNGAIYSGSMLYECNSIERVVLPEGSKLGYQAFCGCSSLKEVVIPEGTSQDGDRVFMYCYSLESVVIPASMTTIRSDAFYRAYSLRFLDFTKHTAVPSLASTSAFSSVCGDCIYLVPAALADEWKAATNWSTYADRIVGV
jgi:hypothetical protein